MVSSHGNTEIPGFRWLKYREGFSTSLVDFVLDEAKPMTVLDPFSGIGTTPIVSAGRGLNALGIEIFPVAQIAAEAITVAATQATSSTFAQSAADLLRRVALSWTPPPIHAFPHVNITTEAFAQETELALAKARAHISSVADGNTRLLLDLACMSVLESVSYTLKDGQYLRWDRRSTKSVNNTLEKRTILEFPSALRQALNLMLGDLSPLRERYGDNAPRLVSNSCLEYMQHIPSSSYDMVITSPPYPNRYDYTRTYALELAWLGYDDSQFKALRQEMLSSTVESKSKETWLVQSYQDSAIFASANRMYENQAAVHEALSILRSSSRQLSNRHVIRMLEGYFLEMALVVAELGRIVRPGGAAVIVADNVQYHGQELPVDMILSDYAEQSGFRCEHIWALARGKGNSSQQMKRFGRRELRKCVYWWTHL